MKPFLRILKANRRLIFTALNAIGVVGTGVLAFRAGKKFAEDPGADWKVGVLPAACAAGTIAAGVASCAAGTKEIAALSAGVGYIVTNRKNLERKAREKFGDDAVDKLKEEAEKLTAKELPLGKQKMAAEETGHGDFLCYESCLGRWFRADPEWVDEGIEKFRDLYQRKDSGVCFNDLYDYWGITESLVGGTFGYPGRACVDTYGPPISDVGMHGTIVDWWLDEDGIEGESVYYISPDVIPEQYWDEY